jgi:hypothetical protein
MVSVVERIWSRSHIQLEGEQKCIISLVFDVQFIAYSEGKI